MNRQLITKPLSFSNDPKLTNGLVLAGGGAKGCYHVGALQAMEENSIQFQGITGTSIGALVGSFYVQKGMGRLTDFVMRMTPEEIAVDLPHIPSTIKQAVKDSGTILEYIIKNYDGRMDITPLKDNFLGIFDWKDFSSSPIAYGCMTYNDTLKEPAPFLKQDMSEDTAMDMIMASAACYPAFPKVEMNGQLYMDGMYADNVPIDLLDEVLPKRDQVMVIDLHGPEEEDPKSLKEGMFYIKPILNPGNRLDFSSEHASLLYNQGYLEALKYLDQNPGYLYTFLPEDEPLMKVVETYLDQQMEQRQIVLPFNDSIQDQCLQSLLGYNPPVLHNSFMKEYRYGKLVEALGLLSHTPEVALYSYTDFLRIVFENLSQLSAAQSDKQDYKVVEMFTRLKREELTVQLHKMLVSGQGRLPAAVESIKERIPVSYTLAYIWYFMEELVRNLS